MISRNILGLPLLFLSSSKLLVWSINIIYQSSSPLCFNSMEWELNDSCFTFSLFSKGTSIITEPCRKSSVVPAYCLQYVLHVNKCTTFSQISHLDFLHGPQNPFFFLTGSTLAVTRMSFKLFTPWKPHEITFGVLRLVLSKGCRNISVSFKLEKLG